MERYKFTYFPIIQMSQHQRLYKTLNMTSYRILFPNIKDVLDNTLVVVIFSSFLLTFLSIK